MVQEPGTSTSMGRGSHTFGGRTTTSLAISGLATRMVAGKTGFHCGKRSTASGGTESVCVVTGSHQRPAAAALCTFVVRYR